MKNLVKMTRSAFTSARANRTLVTPNVALISDETGKIEYTPYLPTTDIGIAAWENNTRKFYSLAEWNALETKPTALGVYVFAEQSQFIIHETWINAVSQNEGKWSNNTQVLVAGCAAAETEAAALLDFAGESNSRAVLDAVARGDIEDAPIFTWANGLTCADPSAKFYVPSCGQAELVRNNLTMINELRAAISQNEILFSTSNYRTSTQKNASAAFLWYVDAWTTTYGKNNGRACFAICSI